MSKRILTHRAVITLAGLLFSNAYAVAPGFYMGFSTGPATNSGGTKQAQVLNSPTTTPVTARSSQWGTSVYMGYKANQYAGGEGGLTYFSGINFDTKNVDTCSAATVRVRDLYLVGKGSVPIGNAVELFAKAGAAVVYQSTSGCLNPELGASCGQTTYKNQVKPTFSLGASYNLSQNWVGDFTYTNIATSSPISTVSFFGFGLSYHFVDTYCGQFLCS